MSKELPSHTENVQAFIDFVYSVKRHVPPHLKRDFIPTFELSEPSLEDRIRAAWDEYGKSYLLEETEEAYGVTMYMLLENLRPPKGQERWLSLGSGPGLYEIFLAQTFPKLSIVSFDISTEQLKIQTQLLKSLPRGHNLRGRISLVRGSMGKLDRVGDNFNQILCLNSLQWCRDWKQAVSEMVRVLSPQEGARVYLTCGSVPVGERGIQLAQGMDTDAVTYEFEKYGLRAEVFGGLKISRGQFGLPTERFYSVFERDSSLTNNWPERLERGKTSLIDYNIAGGIIEKIDYTKNIKANYS